MIRGRRERDEDEGRRGHLISRMKDDECIFVYFHAILLI